MSFEIGTKVRVECNGESKRGVIAYINISSPLLSTSTSTLINNKEKKSKRSYDIIYYDNKEENDVCEDRIYELLQLEYNCEYLSLIDNSNNLENSNNSNNSQNSINLVNNKLNLTSLSLFKECGNNLFEIKDYSAAYEYYIKVFQCIQEKNSLTIGQRVLINVGNGPSERFEIGIISDKHENERYDVIYDALVNGSDEEENIPLKRIVKIYQDENSDKSIIALELQRSIFMNLSKTATKRKLKGWAVRWALLAFGLIKGELTKFSEDKRGKYLTDSLFILSKAFLTSSRPQLARKVAFQLSYTEKSFSIPTKSIRSTNLIKEIDQFLVKKQKENKILARNIAEWVDTAMTINQQHQQERNNKGSNDVEISNDEDVQIGDDLDEINIEFDNISPIAQGKERSKNSSRNSKYDGGGDYEEKDSKKISYDDDNKNDEKGINQNNQKNEECVLS